MSDATLTPADEAEVSALVAEARAARAPLAIRGGSTRAGLGRPVQTAGTLSTARLTGLTLHEPAETVLSARSGTPLSQVEAALAAHRQRLAFEPMDHRPLLGSKGEPTIGGVVAANVSGPRRISVGACRDALIGVRLVTGRGEVVKNGGRVMKNVTGLDLVKLLAGSYGTLGVLTEVTFKVAAIPESSLTLAWRGLDDARAVAALSAALGSPYEPTGAAHLPAGLDAPVPDPAAAWTLLRLEGFPASLAYRAGRLAAELKPFGAPERIEGEAAEALWRAVRDATPLAEPRERAVWRVSVAPSKGPGVAAALARAREAAWFYDWGGGLVWLACDPSGDAGAAALRAAAVGGHATLVRAPAELRARVSPFHPPAEALLRVTRAIKASFDPAGVLEPGRMFAGA